VEEAMRTLEGYCAFQERSHQEVEKKLAAMQLIPAAKEQIISHLLQQDFLNEERFAKSYVRGKFSQKKWGRIKIVQGLKRRQISSYNIQTALKEIDENTYLDTLKTLADKKWPLIRETDVYKKRNKLSRFLLSKGYESTLVYKEVEGFV
jgi:regulatory protein